MKFSSVVADLERYPVILPFLCNAAIRQKLGFRFVFQFQRVILIEPALRNNAAAGVTVNNAPVLDILIETDSLSGDWFWRDRQA